MTLSLTLSPTSLGQPVSTSRKFTNALVPRDGGWRYIAQYYNYPENHDTEWVVMDVETGAYHIDTDVPHITAGQRGKYANTGYTISFGVPGSTNAQMRAPNGRVFWPAVSGWLWCYDPADGIVHDLGAVQLGSAYETGLYQAKFNHDGSKLYVGSIAVKTTAFRPLVAEVDPNTLAIRTLCRVGSMDHTQDAYAYYIQADGDWLYVLVGEDIWDVCAVRISTGEMTVLAQETGPMPWANWEQHKEGLTVRLYKNLKQPNQTIRQWWLIDGQLVPYTAGYNPATLPFAPRDTTPYLNPIVHPPQIDESFGLGRLLWRPYGSTGAWTANDFTITYRSPIPIQSLSALPDGTIAGSVQQYLGFFRVDPANSYHSDYYGAFLGQTEGTARVVVDGKLYISGYPNAGLYEYDPSQPWTQRNRDFGKNPALLGFYSDGVNMSGVKHGEQLAYSAGKNRIYMAGVRDRSGVGSGIGYYDRTLKKFAGTFAGLNFYVGNVGIVALDSIDRVVFSGEIGPDASFPGQTPTEAQLVLYNRDLTEIERVTPVPGLTSTGRLFPAGDSATVVVGLSRKGKTAYRYDVASKTLLGQLDLSAYAAIDMQDLAVQDDAGRIWVVLDSDLAWIDSVTLELTVVGTLSDRGVTAMCRQGRDLYLAIGATLYLLPNTVP